MPAARWPAAAAAAARGQWGPPSNWYGIDPKGLRFPPAQNRVFVIELTIRKAKELRGLIEITGDGKDTRAFRGGPKGWAGVGILLSPPAKAARKITITATP